MVKPVSGSPFLSFSICLFRQLIFDILLLSDFYDAIVRFGGESYIFGWLKLWVLYRLMIRCIFWLYHRVSSRCPSMATRLPHGAYTKFPVEDPWIVPYMFSWLNNLDICILRYIYTALQSDTGASYLNSMTSYLLHGANKELATFHDWRKLLIP